MIIKNKKGVSNVIGYVLLIAVAVTVSIAVYGFLQSYLPGQVEECPDGVSLVLGDYECGGEILNITLINNGKFNIEKFIIKATNDTERMATDPLVSNNPGMVARHQTGEHIFREEKLEPGKKTQKISFNLSEGKLDYGDKVKIELVAIRQGKVCRGSRFEREIECN